MAKSKSKSKAEPISTKAARDAFAQDAHDMGDSYAPAFIFTDPGATIVGRVVEIGTAYSRGYGEHPCVTVLDGDSGERRSIHVFHTTLVSQMERANPKIGERIAVKRLDDRKNPKGQTYQNFRVKVDRSEGAPLSFAQVNTDLQREAARAAEPEPAETPDVTEPDDDLPF